MLLLACVTQSFVAPLAAYCGLHKYSNAVVQMCVLGGHNGSAWLETVTTHRPHVKGWGRLPNLDGPRSFAAADTWNRNVFVMGGGDGNVWFNSVLRYDPSKHTHFE